MLLLENNNNSRPMLLFPIRSYWSNGHLEGKASSTNGIVTRWARGVKVAEPLVKYDPIKAEKQV